MKESKATAGESENSLKLALLYILYGILLIRDYKWKRLDLRYMHLVDDLSNFNEFPLGLVAFEFLVRSTHRARDVVENMLAKNKNLTFDANGLSIALLIFVYKVVPSIGRECVKFVPGSTDLIPRMMRC